MKITSKLKLALKSILSLQFGEVATDKATLVFDGENLEVGMEVFVMGENDEPVIAEDGDYVTEDGKTIKVVEGKVAEITEPAAEEPAEEPVAEEPAENVEAAEETPIETPAEEPIETPEETETNDAEARIAALEARVAELAGGIEQILNAVAAMEQKVAELEGKVAKAEEPAADPIETPAPEENTVMSRLSYLRKN